MISDVPRASPAVAVIVAVPSPAPRTSPDASTVATETSLDAQENSAPATKCPFSSNTSAARRTVSPSAMVAAAGETTTEPADCITVTTASPDADPAVAVIVAAPLPAAPTSPEPSTVATIVSPLAHETGSPSITRPA